jgi:hypothetical protein
VQFGAQSFPEAGVGILRTLIETFQPSAATADTAELDSSALAAAQAAMDEAIRKRQAEDRRAAAAGDRRTSDGASYTGPERRSGDRRRGGAFGRRTRD